MSATPSTHVFVLVRSLSILAILTAVGPAALAQPEGKRGFRDLARSMMPEFLRRDLPMFVEQLSLDHDQGTTAEILILDYEVAFGEALATMREELRTLRPDLAMTDEERRARKANRKALSQERKDLQKRARATRKAAEANGTRVDETRMQEMSARKLWLKEQIKALEDPRPGSAAVRETARGVMDILEAWRLERQALADEFLENLRAQLNPTQSERWPQFLRKLRRLKSLRRGRLAGERVDLHLVLAETGVDASLVEDLTNAYAASLDAALVARDRHLNDGASDLFDAMAVGDEDRAAALQAQESALRVAIRAVNERFAEALAVAIEERVGPAPVAQFRSNWHQRAYPGIYEPTRTQRAFMAARALGDLPEESRLAILALEEQYLADLAAKSRALVEILHEQGPLKLEERVRRTAERLSGADRERLLELNRLEGREDELREMRRDQGDRYRAQLDGLLTPEQIALLPESRPARDLRKTQERQAKRELEAREKQAKLERRAQKEAARRERKAQERAERAERKRAGLPK